MKRLWFQNGRRNVKVIYNTALPVIFRAPKYASSLWKVAEKKNIKVNLNVDLIEVRRDKNEAVFKSLSKPDETFVQEVSFSSLLLVHFLYFKGT